MKVLVGQLNPTVGAIEKNLAAMMQAVRDNPTAQIVVFPELAVSGYPPKDLLAYPDFVQACLKANDALQKLSTPNRLVIWGNIGRHTGPGKPLMNAGYAAFNGHIIATATKCHLPTYDVFDEARYFEPAYPQHAVAFFEAFNQRFALTLCEDLWSHPAIADMQKDSVAPVTYPSTPLHTLAQTSCDIIVNLSASPYELNKPALRRELVQQIAQVQQAAILYVNQVGANDDVIFDGNSLLCLANGATWQAQAFVSDAALLDIQLCSRLCTQSVGEALVASRPVTRQGNQDESIVVACHHCGRPQGPPLQENHFSVEAELIEALTLGIRDYFDKTGFQRAYLGLSGGIDSALVAALASRALGPANVVGVAMPGPYSSDHSLSDAQALAEALGMECRIHSINPLFEAAVGLLSGGKLQHDLAEQNLQSRLRGLILMTLANREGGLVLATGNKSELATGYSTLYGDTCGALAPIADILKTQVYALAREINRQAGRAIIPVTILEKPPSAELAPGQLDSDSLPAYDTLDAILTSFVVAHQGFGEIRRLGYDGTTVTNVLDRVMINEFKRRQMPPSLKVSSKAFGSGRMMPIVQQTVLEPNA